MGGRFRNSLDLAKSSWSLLKSDKQLIWLPVISTLATLVAIATFALPVLALSNMSGGSFKPLAIAVGVFGYFVLAYITVFFNAALVFAADELIRGGKPTIGTAIVGAKSRAHRILPWAIVSAIVSVILRALENRGGVVGRIVGMIAGIAWSLVTFLVLPILVLEGIGVRDALKRSAKLFKGTWGEQVIANAGISIIGFVALIPALLRGRAGRGKRHVDRRRPSRRHRGDLRRHRARHHRRAHRCVPDRALPLRREWHAARRVRRERAARRLQAPPAANAAASSDPTSKTRSWSQKQWTSPRFLGPRRVRGRSTRWRRRRAR